MNIKFYRCKVCGKIIAIVGGCSSCPTVCCGQEMEELVPNTQDGAFDKHVPVYTIQNNIVNVNVGAVNHPMIEKHYIQWVALITNKGYKMNYLNWGEEPATSFALLEGEEVLEVHAYCNIHGLYKAN